MVTATTKKATGRTALVNTARRLFADRGVDAVSMREVARVSGHRNTNAVKYHFAGREGLLAAVLEKHEREVAASRHAMLDHLANQPEVTLEGLADVLVRPSARQLETVEGCQYLRISAELFLRDPARYAEAVKPIDAGLVRWQHECLALMPPITRPLHRRFSASSLCYHELGRRAADTRGRTQDLFVSNLVDLVVGLLRAEVSNETARLLRARDGVNNSE